MPIADLVIVEAFVIAAIIVAVVVGVLFEWLSGREDAHLHSPPHPIGGSTGDTRDSNDGDGDSCGCGDGGDA
ncbi:hypothetical protein [Planobispora longispora]|uniref:Uncharacterized protein n=1 Tax=Planobispora longispora TaxID=28887 RepID=A0A8J3W6U7_9ACTN|nr:hypothetical protein [Planobispora longispora]GIH78904.1 hypothetical protein Plo01_53330 [Planobispora longispora]